MTLEFCIDSAKGAEWAKKYQAKRVELCSALSIGGLSPSAALIKQCLAVDGPEVHAMVRPREGNFCYSEPELLLMQEEFENFAQLGLHGLVFGCLNEDQKLDVEANRVLIELAKKHRLECTLHRAFDFGSDLLKNLELAIQLGFDRILSSGGQAKAMEGIETLARMSQQARGRIQIMGGSGVNAKNAKALQEAGLDALHFTIHQKMESSELGMGENYRLDAEKIKSITKALT